LHRLYHDSIEEFPPHYLIRSSGFFVSYKKEVDEFGGGETEKITIFVV
jgi:hypothetical protein